MILVLYILGLPSPSHPPSLFFKSFRITQTRLMVLSIIHGLGPNPKLKAILEGCANLDHLWGLSLTSRYLFSKDFFPSKLCINPIHPFHQHATHILYWSAIHHVLGRGCSRSKKKNQLSNGKLVQAELALRY